MIRQEPDPASPRSSCARRPSASSGVNTADGMLCMASASAAETLSQLGDVEPGAAQPEQRLDPRGGDVDRPVLAGDLHGRRPAGAGAGDDLHRLEIADADVAQLAPRLAGGETGGP